MPGRNRYFRRIRTLRETLAEPFQSERDITAGAVRLDFGTAWSRRGVLPPVIERLPGIGGGRRDVDQSADSLVMAYRSGTSLHTGTPIEWLIAVGRYLSGMGRCLPGMIYSGFSRRS